MKKLAQRDSDLYLVMLAVVAGRCQDPCVLNPHPRLYPLRHLLTILNFRETELMKEWLIKGTPITNHFFKQKAKNLTSKYSCVIYKIKQIICRNQ